MQEEKGRAAAHRQGGLLLGSLFLANFVEMILEMAAGRALSPYFGSGNYAWTAIIGIIMLAGVLGNLAGGKLSSGPMDAGEAVSCSMSAASVAVSAARGCKDALGQALAISLSAKAGPVAASVLLFFLPSFFLSCAVPVALQEFSQGKGKSGGRLGLAHAVAAAGALAGTFLGGFWAVPAFGVSGILLALAVATAAAGLLAALVGGGGMRAACIAFAVAALCIAAISWLTGHAQGAALGSAGGFWLETDTEYSHIIIYDGEIEGEPARFFTASGGYESGTFLEDGKRNELVFPYLEAYGEAAHKGPKGRSLMIGGAAYAYPKWFISHFPEKSMDVIEIDPMATELAKEYFFLDELVREFHTDETGRLRLYNGDGRIFLQETDGEYSVIYNDAFSGKIPARTLATREAAELVRSRLAPGGIYALNCIGILEGDASRVMKSILYTIGSVFQNVYVARTQEGIPDTEIQNWIVFASDAEYDFANTVPFSYGDGAQLLTDDWCPIEAMYDGVYLGK